MKRNKNGPPLITIVQNAWFARPKEARKTRNGEAFADQMWDSGNRLASNRTLHYQLVMHAVDAHTSG